MDNTTPTGKITTELLERMEKKILKTRPQLKKIKENYGSMSYYNYSKRKNRTTLNQHFRERKSDVISVIKTETARLLGSAIASDVEKQFKRNDSVSTAEHTAPIGTTHVLSAGLHVAVPMFENDDPRLGNLIILSCSGVSFNNVLSFSRGFQFHTLKDGQIIDNQIAFFGRSSDAETILFSPPYSADNITEIKKKLRQDVIESKIEKKELEKIAGLLDTVYAHPHALTGKDYGDQMTITNYYLWKKLFPSYRDGQIPNYVMLSQEKILLQLLLNFHLDHDTVVHHFLFDKKYTDLIEKYFSGIIGAFSQDGSAGTFLFWGLSKKDGTRFQLFREGQMLVNRDRNYSLPLEKEAVREAILKNEIFPGLLLTFSVFSFYYGLLLGGGASQPTYLTAMKNAYISMMRELGDLETVHDSEESVTDDFVFFRPHLAFFDAHGERISSTGLDMYLYQDPARWRNIVNATKSITLSEFIEVLLPILYKQFCPDDEKEDALMQISRQEVENFTGFDKKLPTLGEIT